MSKLRILVVDDAVLARKALTEALRGDPSIEVVGTAANGRIALQKIAQLGPDLVTLDIEMPEMDGLETLAAIRKAWPALPVVIVSSLAERAAAATLDALARGASDYVTKPSGAGSLAGSLRRIRDELLPKVHALCGRAVAAAENGLQGPRPPSPPAAPAHPRTAARSIDVVAIGVSTGGPEALATLLPAMPSSLPVPIVITQHMPPLFTRLLAQRLDSQCPLRVVESVEGQSLEAGTVYVAPGDRHLAFARAGGRVRVRLSEAPPENSCRPSADVMFASAVDAYGAATLGVVLTGMGRDGLRGCERIRAAGGAVLAQDEASSVIWGMPGLVARAGLADAVVPLSAMSAEIVRRLGSPLEAERPASPCS